MLKEGLISVGSKKVEEPDPLDPEIIKRFDNHFQYNPYVLPFQHICLELASLTVIPQNPAAHSVLEVPLRLVARDSRSSYTRRSPPLRVSYACN